MAIKRSTKSRGVALRKSGTSVTVRHVDVRALQSMVAGATYPGWLCKNKACGRVIAIAPALLADEQAASIPEDQLTAIKCPHCGDEDLYRWSARAEHVFVAHGAPA